MAGFLDRSTRIIDLVLTGYGKSLLSKGQLNFCYWIPFDDETDYQPYISQSGSLSSAQLTAAFNESIELSPVREATTGYRSFNSSGSDFTNVHRPLFTMAQGQTVLPRTIFPVTSSREVSTKQRRVQRLYIDRDVGGKFVSPIDPVDIGVERFESTSFTLEFSYMKDSFPTDFQPEGFSVKMFKSGSFGLIEVDPRRDMSNDLSYTNDVRVFTGRRGG